MFMGVTKLFAIIPVPGFIHCISTTAARSSALLLIVDPATVTGAVPPITEPAAIYIGKPTSTYVNAAFIASSGYDSGAAASIFPISSCPAAWAIYVSHIYVPVALAPLVIFVECLSRWARLVAHSITGSTPSISKYGV
jgi:hypothetical protein